MARGSRKRGTEAAPAPAPTEKRSKSKSNVTDDTIKTHLNVIIPLEAEWQRLVAEANSARGSYRNALKVAKKDGINPDSITDAIKMNKGEHHEIRMKSEMTRRVLGCMGSPIATIYREQGDLFEAPQTGAANVANAGDIAYAQGEQACRESAPRNHNSYAFGTDEHAAWNNGWDSAFKGGLSGKPEQALGEPAPAA